MRLSLFLPLLSLTVAVCTAAGPEEAPFRHGCGTARQFEARIAPSPFKTSQSARLAATPKLTGRALITAHFALHYTLGYNVHQPILDTSSTADVRLKVVRDSLHLFFTTANPSFSLTRLDSLVNDRLDTLGAAHPVYVQNAAAYFENAYAYYGDTLGMLRPDSNVSDFFQRSIPGKFNVDIGDIDTFEGYNGTFGLTYVPVGPYSATLVLENDFLYNASANSNTGVVTGTPITNRATLLNYNKEWNKGIAVTIAHEFFHAVQFKYTPSVSGGFHSWYELSAVAMEERLAPTVNDYLGYLNDLLPVSTPVSLFSTGGTNANYGNGIFHIFLSHTLGKAFDVPIWNALRTNGNSLGNALVTGAGSQARWDSLYAAYAAALAVAGRPGSQASPLAFSPDFSVWPQARIDTAGTAGSTLSLPALAYRLIAPVPSAVTWASYPGIRGAWRVARSGPIFSTQFLGDSAAPISPNGTLALAVANSNFTAKALTLKRTALQPSLAAFPNPAKRSGTIHFEIPAGGSTAPITLVSESGKRVATLSADTLGSFWTWDFRDAQGQSLPAGVYYFGITGQTPQALVVLP